jgi:hypothetical protein
MVSDSFDLDRPTPTELIPPSGVMSGVDRGVEGWTSDPIAGIRGLDAARPGTSRVRVDRYLEQDIPESDVDDRVGRTGVVACRPWLSPN